jgi:hypothetical protein
MNRDNYNFLNNGKHDIEKRVLTYHNFLKVRLWKKCGRNYRRNIEYTVFNPANYNYNHK